MTDKSEFERWVSVAEVGRNGLRQCLEASRPELSALAKRYRIPAVKSLVAEIEVRPVGRTRYRLEGGFEATVVQTCVVTLEELENRVAERFTVDFEPMTAAEAETLEVEIDVEADDPPEPLVDGRIPVGEMVAQYLALAIDPYPRAPDAELDSAAADSGRQSPFAILRKLG